MTAPPAPGVPADLAGALSGFTGRDWVFSALDSWTALGDPGLLLLGGPGTGKSLLMAELARRKGIGVRSEAVDALSAWHFCRSTSPTSCLPEHVIGTLAAQLSQLPGYLEALTSSEPVVGATLRAEVNVHGQVGAGAVVTAAQVTLVDAAPARRFDRLIRAPLASMASAGALPNCCLLVVDGLDETLGMADGELLIGMLARHLAAPDSLPPGVRLLVTARPDTRITSRLRIPQLDLADARTADDIASYVRGRLSGLADRDAIDRLIRRVVSVSEGTFLYARYVLDDLLRGPSQDLDTLELPEGLAGYYAESLDRELTTLSEQWEERYRPLLGALAVARTPGLTEHELMCITGLPASRVADALKRCSPYLIGRPPGPYRMFHQSFVDYLLEADAHSVYPAEAHAAVARYLLTQTGARAEQDLVWHLAGAGDIDALDAVMSPEHLTTALRRAGEWEVADELRIAASAAVRAADVRRALRWSWASVGRRRHAFEAVTPALVPLLARSGRLDEAVRAVAGVDPGELLHSDLATAVAECLVDGGRVGDAIALVERANLRWGTAAARGRIAERLASRDPEAALRLLPDTEAIPNRAGVCAALAQAGPKYFNTAEKLADGDRAALAAVAVVESRVDLGRALQLGDRVPVGYERAAARKVPQTKMTLYAQVLMELAQTDPRAAAAGIDRLMARSDLWGLDRDRAQLATAMRMVAVDGHEALKAVQRWVGGPDTGAAETTEGLLFAAVATSPEKTVRRAAREMYAGRAACSYAHGSDPDLLHGLDLAPLRRTPESVGIAREVLLHSVSVLDRNLVKFEYPGTGIGALAAALAALGAIDEAEAAVDRLAQRQGSPSVIRNDAMELVAPAAAAVDAQRALDIALSMSGYGSHLAVVAVIGAVAARDLPAALSLVDRIDERYSMTRAAALGACSAHLHTDAPDQIAQLWARIPGRAASATFLHPFVAAAGVLAGAMRDADAAAAQALLERWLADYVDGDSLQDPYRAANARAVAAREPNAALALVHSMRRADLQAGALADVLVAAGAGIEQIVAEVGKIRCGFLVLAPDTTESIVRLIRHAAAIDPSAAVALAADYGGANLLAVARDELCAAVFDRWGAEDGALRLTNAILALPVRDNFARFERYSRIAGVFVGRPPSVEDAVVAAAHAHPDIARQLAAWRVAHDDPLQALEIWRDLGEDSFGRRAVMVRAGQFGLDSVFDVYRLIERPDEDDEESLLAAVGLAAQTDPNRARIALASAPERISRNRLLRAWAVGAARLDPVAAAESLGDIGDEYIGGAAVSAVARSLPAEPPDAALAALLRRCEALGAARRTDAITDVAAAIARCTHPSRALISACIHAAAQHELDSFDRALPHLAVAAWAADPVLRSDPAAELEAIAKLVLA